MNTVIVYDIASNRRRGRLSKFLKEMGIRAQKSVFECRLDGREIARIRAYCRRHLNLDQDTVRIYRVCSRCMAKAVIQGQGVHFSQLDWTIL